MIVTLHGTVTARTASSAVIDVHGVGYEVRLNKQGIAGLAVGKEARLWTHEHIREDARELYGFLAAEEHRLFLRLLDVSGVGPKMAQNILALGPVAEIEKMIEKGDVVWMTRIPGIGKKTAQKIVLELKGKLVDEEGGAEGSEEVVSALVNLGYSRDQARRALEHAGAGSAEERLRGALRQLGK
jgi:Holliday junction DNA helicase RuvA